MALALLLITFFLGLVPFFLIIIKPFKINKDVIKDFLPFIYLLFIATCYEFIASHMLKIRTAIYFRSYLLLEFLAIYYFFTHIFKSKFRKIFNLYLIIYIVLWMLLWLVWNPKSSVRTDTYLILVESLFVYTFAILWFKELFNKAIIESLWRLPYFYFIGGLMFYFSGTIFLFLLIGHIIDHKDISFESYWLVNVGVSFVWRILLIIGIWKARQK